MITKRTRELAAPRAKVWEVVGDAYHHPRWWPRVDRVEGVTRAGWTSVLTSGRGNTVRVDWKVEVNRQPTERRWTQEIEGTPFERLFKHNAVEARLERGDAGGTRVTLLFDQQPRGLARFLPCMLRRAMGRQLDAALDGLAQAVE